jgi:hypothetical protein
MGHFPTPWSLSMSLVYVSNVFKANSQHPKEGNTHETWLHFAAANITLLVLQTCYTSVYVCDMLPYFEYFDIFSSFNLCLQDNFVRVKALHREEAARSWFLVSETYGIYHGNRLVERQVQFCRFWYQACKLCWGSDSSCMLAHVYTDRNCNIAILICIYIYRYIIRVIIYHILLIDSLTLMDLHPRRLCFDIDLVSKRHHLKTWLCLKMSYICPRYGHQTSDKLSTIVKPCETVSHWYGWFGVLPRCWGHKPTQSGLRLHRSRRWLPRSSGL